MKRRPEREPPPGRRAAATAPTKARAGARASAPAAAIRRARARGRPPDQARAADRGASEGDRRDAEGREQEAALLVGDDEPEDRQQGQQQRRLEAAPQARGRDGGGAGEADARGEQHRTERGRSPTDVVVPGAHLGAAVERRQGRPGIATGIERIAGDDGVAHVPEAARRQHGRERPRARGRAGRRAARGAQATRRGDNGRASTAPAYLVPIARPIAAASASRSRGRARRAPQPPRERKRRQQERGQPEVGHRGPDLLHTSGISRNASAAASAGPAPAGLAHGGDDRGPPAPRTAPGRRRRDVGAQRPHQEQEHELEIAGAYADDGSPNTAGTIERRPSCAQVAGTCR